MPPPSRRSAPGAAGLLDVRGGEDLRRISRELRRMDERELRKRFTRELLHAAAPLVPAVRAAALAIPAKGPRSTGLRARLAKATRLSVRTAGRQAGIRILVDPRRMPDRERALPQMMEGTRRWKHLVFGGGRWVTQPPHPFFFRTVRPLGVTSRRAVNRVIDGVTRDIS